MKSAPTVEDIRRVMVELGKRGGKARAKAQKPEERTESARNAANVRWNGKRRKGRETASNTQHGQSDTV